MFLSGYVGGGRSAVLEEHAARHKINVTLRPECAHVSEDTRARGKSGSDLSDLSGFYV